MSYFYSVLFLFCFLLVILFLPLEHKIEIFLPPCNILYSFKHEKFWAKYVTKHKEVDQASKWVNLYYDISRIIGATLRKPRLTRHHDDIEAKVCVRGIYFANDADVMTRRH